MPVKPQSILGNDAVRNYSLPTVLPAQNLPTTQSPSSVSEKLNKLRQKVFDKRPALSSILNELGPMTMYQVSQAYAKTQTTDISAERKNELIQAFSSEVGKLLGQGVAASVSRQLAEHYYVSTAEHHSPLTTPDYLNSSVHTALYTSSAKNSKLENIIVLACANISFDNYGSPRALVFNSLSGNKAVLNQIPLFPRSVRPCPVIYYPAYTKQSILDAKVRIDSLLKDGTIKPKDAEKLYFLIDRIYARSDVLSLPYFSDQITKTNYLLWNRLFFFLGKYTPNLIYFEQERLVNKLLVENHLYKPTIINKIIFNPKYHKLLEKHFDGISGAFSLKARQGTYLFWALPPGQRYRVSLWIKGNKLISEDGSYEVELTPESICKAILDKELIPSTMLDYVLLGFYYGLRLHGGINQPTTLTKTKLAYINMLQEIEDSKNIEQCKNVPTTALSMHRPSLAFLKLHDGTRIPASTIDILLYGNEHSWKTMKQNSKVINFEDTFLRNLPNIYKFIHKKDELDENLLSLSEHDIDVATGFDKKIEAFAEL